jgi:molybdopterin/thiamine biosynthesis adenylyltransferase
VQENIKNATVTVLGTGGTGSWIIQSLVMAGIGNIIRIDFDTIELHNLTRQTLYFTEDIGKLKTQVLVKRIKEINPNVKVKTFNVELKNDTQLKKFFDGSDLVINCTDSPDINTTSSWVSDACMALNIPHIVGGGYNGHVGMIGPSIIPYQTACWNCYTIDYNEKAETGEKLSYVAGDSKFSGAIASLSAIVANIQAWDALRIIGKIGDPLLANKKGELYFDDLRITWTDINQKNNCKWCSQKKGGTQNA